MGTSNWQNISYNIDIIKRINPNSILDIGVGFGRWGVLFREFLEIWDDENYSFNWKRSVEGVEIYSGYIQPYHKYFYNKIFIEDAYGFLINTESNWDLINFGDVLEHFDKPVALDIINIGLQKSQYLLINIPIGYNWEQGVVNNNEYQIHRSIWFISDFRKYSYSKIKKFRDINKRHFAVVLLSKDPFDYEINYKHKYGNYFDIKNTLIYVLHLRFLKKFFNK